MAARLAIGLVFLLSPAAQRELFCKVALALEPRGRFLFTAPVQAGAVQLLVLIGLLLVQALAVTVTIELISAGLLPIGAEPLPE